jgi:5-methylcytosine-specific restriction endonuclease McrA
VGFTSPDEHRRRGRDGGRVLVLNATYEPINVCTVRRAAILLLKSKAEVVEQAAWELRSEHTAMARPVVIRLVSYVNVPADTHRRKITRRAVFARDNWTCQYCGSRQQLTVDHVIPRSKGGSSDWTNIVAACAPATAARATSCRPAPACTRSSSRRAAPRRLHPRRVAHDPRSLAPVAAGREHRVVDDDPVRRRRGLSLRPPGGAAAGRPRRPRAPRPPAR